MSPEICRAEEADAIRPAEGNISVLGKARALRLLRGQRPWHVTHGYVTATRETLLLFRKGVRPTSDTKQGSQMVSRESDRRIVLMIRSNVRGGKAVTDY